MDGEGVPNKASSELASAVPYLTFLPGSLDRENTKVPWAQSSQSTITVQVYADTHLSLLQTRPEHRTLELGNTGPFVMVSLSSMLIWGPQGPGNIRLSSLDIQQRTVP